MNPPKTNPAAIIDAEIDRILAAEEPLVPSSGFLASVMERVQEEARVSQEASAPPPIHFPWKRVLPGLLLSVGLVAWGAVLLLRSGLPALTLPKLDLTTLGALILAPPPLPAALVAPAQSAAWVALALAISLLSWLFARHLAGSGGLL